MTALALAPDTRTGYEPGVTASVDRAIRVSTAIAVLAVAGVAAYVSYWHAYAVVRAHGETGVTARLEPATIDGLVYASSMVNLYAARHRLTVPALARWLLVLGIVATLAANMAQGWSHGAVGAVIAAWPAVSLVGSYELLVWIIRTAVAGGLDRGPAAGQTRPIPDHSRPDLHLDPDSWPGPGAGHRAMNREFPARRTWDRPMPAHVGGPARDTGPDAGQLCPDSHLVIAATNQAGSDEEVNAAAVAAYGASVASGMPLSERKLAARFGRSRRWARSRMAESREAMAMAYRDARRLLPRTRRLPAPHGAGTSPLFPRFGARLAAGGAFASRRSTLVYGACRQRLVRGTPGGNDRPRRSAGASSGTGTRQCRARPGTSLTRVRYHGPVVSVGMAAEKLGGTEARPR
jgi:Protein of unknown function (DUF2637)